jgi:hypothetical protein
MPSRWLAWIVGLVPLALAALFAWTSACPARPAGLRTLEVVAAPIASSAAEAAPSMGAALNRVDVDVRADVSGCAVASDGDDGAHGFLLAIESEAEPEDDGDEEDDSEFGAIPPDRRDADNLLGVRAAEVRFGRDLGRSVPFKWEGIRPSAEHRRSAERPPARRA